MTKIIQLINSDIDNSGFKYLLGLGDDGDVYKAVIDLNSKRCWKIYLSSEITASDHILPDLDFLSELERHKTDGDNNE